MDNYWRIRYETLGQEFAYLMCKADNITDFSDEAKIQWGGEMKEIGNKFFRQGDFHAATLIYETIVDGFVPNLPDEDTRFDRFVHLLKSCYLNLTACYLKEGEFNKVVDLCTEIIMYDDVCTKALFRRGQAYLQQGQFTNALSDFHKAHKLEPSDKSIGKELLSLTEKLGKRNPILRQSDKVLVGVRKPEGNVTRNDIAMEECLASKDGSSLTNGETVIELNKTQSGHRHSSDSLKTERVNKRKFEPLSFHSSSDDESSVVGMKFKDVKDVLLTDHVEHEVIEGEREIDGGEKQTGVIPEISEATQNGKIDEMNWSSLAEAVENRVKDGRSLRMDNQFPPPNCNQPPSVQAYTFQNTKKPSSRLRVPITNMKKLSKGEEISVYNPYTCTLMTVRVIKLQTTILTETPDDNLSRGAVVSSNPMELDNNLHDMALNEPNDPTLTIKDEDYNKLQFGSVAKVQAQGASPVKRRRVAGRNLEPTSSVQQVLVTSTSRSTHYPKVQSRSRVAFKRSHQRLRQKSNLKDDAHLRRATFYFTLCGKTCRLVSSCEFFSSNKRKTRQLFSDNLVMCKKQYVCSRV